MTLKLVATRKSHQNTAVLDPWTIVHLSTGLAVGLMDFPFGPTMAAAVVYEGVEQVVERHPVGQEFFNTKRPEHHLNAIVDVAVFAAGYWLGRRWNRS